LAERIRIGLIFSYNKNWIAGSYYILNLIQALKLLNDNLKPSLVIISFSEDDFIKIKQINYPYISYKVITIEGIKVTYPITYRIINKFFRIFKIDKILYKTSKLKVKSLGIDFLFPSLNIPFFKPIKKIFWIPDLQEHFLPQFFKEKEIKHRKLEQQKLIKQNEMIVFSSYDALTHFKNIYPKAKNLTKVLQFAVTHPNYNQLNFKKVLEKYKINRSYYFCSNQFWAHKNHKIILEALKILKKQNREVLVVFSGKESDYRNPNFFDELQDYININKIENQVKFLGFIDREEQLLLMEKSIAVIQPSLFEGWSTVVEDVKAMNQHIIVSSIEVHKEQLTNNMTYFEPNNAVELANIMLKFIDMEPPKIKNDYEENKHKFANDFINIIKSLKIKL